MKNNSVRLLILLLALLAAAISVGTAVTRKSAKTEPSLAASPVQIQGAMDPGGPKEKEQHYDYLYLVKDYQGRVAIFNAGRENMPRFITDVDVRTLPSADRDSLLDGIQISSETELASLMEDLDAEY